MNHPKASEMMIVSTLFVRGLLLHTILTKKTKDGQERELTDVAKSNFLTFSSILYYIFMDDYFQMPKDRDSQEHLMEEEKTIPACLIFGSNIKLDYENSIHNICRN